MLVGAALLASLAGCQGDPAPTRASLDEATRAEPARPSVDVRAELSEASRQALAAAPYERVLMLDAPWREGVVVTSGPGFYALSARRGDVTISLHATATVHQGAVATHGTEPTDEVRGVPARASMNDGIRGLAWEEDAIAYALEVECFDALTDPRCTEDAFLRERAEALTAVVP